jgi:PAS domain S-box-containing protein
MKIALLFFVSLFTFFSTFAQTEEMAFKNLTTSMGLSHGDVTCIYQDQDGYLWFGTVNGLNKYNGIEFSVYNNIKNDTTSISNNYIISIYVDKQNNVWIGTDGLCRYNRDKNNFERIPIIDNHNKLLHYTVTAICEDKQNRLWIGTNFGVFLFDSKNKRFIQYFADNYGKEMINCTGICCDKNGILWSSFNDSKAGGLLKYDPEKKISTFYNSQQSVLKLQENFVNCLYIDNKNNIWIGYVNKGVDVFNEKTQTISNYHFDPKNENSLNNNTIFSITQNTDGKILIGTNGGLNILDTKTNIFEHYIASESDRSLLSNTIQNIYIGFEGTIWIACWAGGVSIFDKRYDKFTHYKHIKQDIHSLSGNSVTCFTEDVNQNIWIATDGGGINYFNPTDKKFINYQSNSKNPQALTNNKVLAITVDMHGDLWAGMWAGGLNYFKINKSELILKKKYQTVDENNPNSTSVFNLYVKKNGQLWVGNFRTGAYFLDTNTYKFTPFPIIDSTNKQLSFIILRDILCDYRNDIWFGTQGNGLIRYNSTTENYEQFVYKEDDSTTLPTNTINVIFEDSKQRLWIGSDEGGLNLFVRKTKKFIHFSTEQGLPNNSIVGILEDNKGNLWISSNNGLSKVTIDTTRVIPKLSFRNYTVQDGLQDKIFNRWAYFKSRTGEMYFGGLNGFNVFNPDSIKDNSFKPPVHITDFFLFNKPVIIGAKGSPLTKHISQTKKIVLNYDQSIFTFRFIALNYIFSEKNQYAYIMEGFEKNWNYVGNKNEATYTNLDPGEYTFRVKASNNDGIWNEKGTVLKIIILPPWWKTLWVKLILGLIILAFIVLLIVKIINKIKRLANQTILDERNQLKTLINNIPDHIFIKDTKSRFLVINNSTVKYMKGKNEKDFIYKSDYDFYPKEMADKFFRQEQEIMSSGIPMMNEESKRIVNGQEMILSTTKCPIISENGETIGLVGIVKDITSQKVAHLEIEKQSEELKNYNTVLSETNVLLEERQQQIEEQSEELQLTNERLLEHQARIEEQAYELRAHGKNLKDKNDLLVEKQQLILKQSEQLKATNQELSLLNATKDRFFSIIAHDLRNPFHVVSGFSEILLKKFDELSPEKIHKFHEIIHISSTNGNNLLENLLQWSRSQTGGISFKPANHNLMAIAEDTIKLLEIDAKRKHITIQQSIESHLTVYADENMIKTIFRNLISNAIKFSGEEGLITLKSQTDNHMAKVTVADTGMGIPAETIKKLFRIDTIVTTKGTANESGTGLGLLLCKEFVGKHGGSISVVSEPGKGSTFSFTLPVKPD